MTSVIKSPPYKYKHTKNPKTAWKKCGKVCLYLKGREENKNIIVLTTFDAGLDNFGNDVVFLEHKSFCQGVFLNGLRLTHL